MFTWILRKIIGSKNQRTIKRLMPVVAEINAIEAQLQNEPEDALRERVAKWQDQFKAFHTPSFLSGVNLRIADDEALDASIADVAGYFDRLTVHFPEINSSELKAAGALSENSRCTVASASGVAAASARPARPACASLK